MKKYIVSALTLVALVLALTAPTAGAARDIGTACPPGFGTAFADVSLLNVHGPAISCIGGWQITHGVTATTYVPSGTVNRGQMATFIARAIVRSGGTLPVNPPDAFTDDGADTHRTSIDQLAAVNIVRGVGGRRFAPGRTVDRAQMATFLIAALEYRVQGTLGAERDYFRDTLNNTHRANINKAFESGLADGVADGVYDPVSPVGRDQMASFLARMMAKLVDDGHTRVPPPTTTSTVPPSTVPPTLPPTTAPPVTLPPTTEPPVTLPPTTVVPPTTAPPTTVVPPTTVPPTTVPPTTVAPPTTVPPTTAPPTTEAPTTTTEPQEP